MIGSLKNCARNFVNDDNDEKNTPGAYINHMLVSDGAKRRALRARRLVRPPINCH